MVEYASLHIRSLQGDIKKKLEIVAYVVSLMAT